MSDRSARASGDQTARLLLPLIPLVGEANELGKVEWGAGACIQCVDAFIQLRPKNAKFLDMRQKVPADLLLISRRQV